MRCSLHVQTILNCQQCFKEASSGKSLEFFPKEDEHSMIGCAQYRASNTNILTPFQLQGALYLTIFRGFYPEYVTESRIQPEKMEEATKMS